RCYPVPLFFDSLTRPPPRSTPFPYTTLFRSRRISEVSWPQHCLLVALRRGEEEILPRGDTMIQAQDTLVALLDEPSAAFSQEMLDRKSTRLNSSHVSISYAVFCLKKKKTKPI